MDTVEAANEIQDWELLQTNSDTEAAPVTSADSFDAIDSSALIQANYFASDPHDRCEVLVDDGDSVGYGSPSWNDPRLGEYSLHRPNKEPCEFWPDSSSERFGDQKFGELEGGNELGFRENEEDAKYEANEVKGEASEDLGDSGMESVGVDGDSAEISDVSEMSRIDGDSAKISDVSEMSVEGDLDMHADSQVSSDEMNEIEGIESGGEVVDVAAGMKNGGGELEKSGVVWWKMPMEFLKYCMMRMNPVWTVSLAAAFMGFVILGRRLYKMKRKSKGLKINVAVDDKKASQVMSRAARLNEAFSVVKLVPVIRPALPAVGSTSSWSVMSLR
ncbi:hypothetical protein SASPL_103504 [Salvia splendens]|uniref:DUF6821 domain-containing protein n=1 Tax=Salvia splendens TaxID=180675 RepID=A0A8X8YJT7_SALSN|nr:uncharacterized protein LOC121781848 [Salvia splendens]KAG6431932.1 hypothetical protein SASPL_103504 [Salvia splendens]